MKKEMTLQAPMVGIVSASDCLKPVARLLAKPLVRLAAYYGAVLGERVTLRQTLHLLHVQVALLLAVFPVDCPLLLRGVCGVWLVSALLKCRRAMAGGTR